MKSHLKRKIRLAHLVHVIGPAGKELGILKLIDNLDQEKFEIFIVVIGVIYEGPTINLPDAQVICLNHMGGNSIKLPLKLRKIFTDHRFDIVHTHSWNTLLEGVIAAKLAGIPMIIHQEHGTFPQGSLHCRLQNFFWRRADKMLSVSRELNKKLAAKTGFPLENIQAILNGVDDEKFYPDDRLRQNFREKFGLSDQDFIIGTVGRMATVKNHAMLLRAAAKLLDQGLSLKIVIAGFPTNETDIAVLARELKIEAHVHLIGYQADINMILNGFDIFALTSFSEGCSNVIQEAMFAEKAIIATNVGGNPELINDQQTGLLVASDDDTQLAKAIHHLKENQTYRERLAKNARNHAIKTFTLLKMVRNYEQVYTSKNF